MNKAEMQPVLDQIVDLLKKHDFAFSLAAYDKSGLTATHSELRPSYSVLVNNGNALFFKDDEQGARRTVEMMVSLKLSLLKELERFDVVIDRISEHYGWDITAYPRRMDSGDN